MSKVLSLNPCPYCQGTGDKKIVKVHQQSGRRLLATELCLCKQSQIISSQYPVLEYLMNSYLPIEEVEKVITFNPDDPINSPNYLLTGPYRAFHSHMKSILMKYRFLGTPISMCMATSIGIIQKFHVPQKDELAPHLSSTETFDLLIITFGMQEDNRALKSGMAQVIYNRRSRKPTWIYNPNPSLSLCKEYSEELDNLLKGYKIVTLACDDEIPNTDSASQREAENFEGLK